MFLAESSVREFAMPVRESVGVRMRRISAPMHCVSTRVRIRGPEHEST